MKFRHIAASYNSSFQNQTFPFAMVFNKKFLASREKMERTDDIKRNIKEAILVSFSYVQ